MLFISDILGENVRLLSPLPLTRAGFLWVSESSLSRRAGLAPPLCSFPSLCSQFKNVTRRGSYGAVPVIQGDTFWTDRSHPLNERGHSFSLPGGSGAALALIGGRSIPLRHRQALLSQARSSTEPREVQATSPQPAADPGSRAALPAKN